MTQHVVAPGELSSTLPPALAAAMAGDEIILAPGLHTLAGPVTVYRSAVRIAGPGAEIRVATDAPGVLFGIRADAVELNDLLFTGSGEPGALASASQHVLAATSCKALRVRRTTFRGLLASIGTLPGTSAAVHSLTLTGVEGAKIERLTIEDISGVGLECLDTSGLAVELSTFARTGWPGLRLHSANQDWRISRCRFDGGTDARPTMWGGLLEVMGQVGTVPSAPDVDGAIEGCRFTGRARYGSALRLQSSQSVTIRDCVFDRPVCDAAAEVGTGEKGAVDAHIVVSVRDFAVGNQGPYRGITIAGCTFRPDGLGRQTAILARTSSGSPFINREPCEDLAIHGCRFEGDVGNAFQSLLGLHGFYAGHRGLSVSDCSGAVWPLGAPNYALAQLAGAIILATYDGATVEDVVVSGRYRRLGGATAPAVNIRRGVTDVVVGPLTAPGFASAVTTEAPSSVVERVGVLEEGAAAQFVR